jgi:hypothetical protein
MCLKQHHPQLVTSSVVPNRDKDNAKIMRGWVESDELTNEGTKPDKSSDFAGEKSSDDFLGEKASFFWRGFIKRRIIHSLRAEFF